MKTFFYYAVAVLFAILIAYALQYFIWRDNVQDVVVETKNEYCLISKAPYGSDFNFSESAPGQYDYQVYATANGYEVWGKCK
jgi:hypothetical protein